MYKEDIFGKWCIVYLQDDVLEMFTIAWAACCMTVLGTLPERLHSCLVAAVRISKSVFLTEWVRAVYCEVSPIT